MTQTRLELLADRVEVLDSEVRNHESEARFHHRMAIQKQVALDRMTDELYDLCDQERSENATNQVALPAYTFENISTAIVADFQRSAR